MNSEPGRVFYFIAMKIYTKPPLNLSEQLDELKKRGLIIDDETSAKQVLSEISYFRFVAYLDFGLDFGFDCFVRVGLFIRKINLVFILVFL